MKKCILVPDSFKGTMSSLEVSEIMKNNIMMAFPDCQVIAIPVADGGEGTVDCFLQALGGEKIYIKTSGPLGETIDSFYGIIGKLAIIEMAASAGFPLAIGKLNPLEASTFGVGELVRDAIQRGCTSIVLGLGGSCTNDAGAGMAVALGAKFYNTSNTEFLPSGGTLGQVAYMDLSKTRELLKDIHVIAMCDIDNPLFGENGAAIIFAPQKGASPQQVATLDSQLRLFAEVIAKELNIDVSTLKGAGAAGGMGAGVRAFLGGELKQGIDTVLDLVGFESLLAECDYVFTGEGRLDLQSLSGKVVIGVANRARAKGVPVIAVVGEKEDDMPDIYHQGVTKVYETSGARKSEEDIRNNCKEDLSISMKRILAEMI
jgi:glycerate 2-kinase